MWKDPIVEEVRKAGRMIERQVGGNLREFFRLLRDSETRGTARTGAGNKVHRVDSVTFTRSRMLLTVDGQQYSCALADASKRLTHARDFERERYEVSPSGYGIHWPLVVEDLSVDGLLKIAKLEKPAYPTKSPDRQELVVAERRDRYTTRRGNG